MRSYRRYFGRLVVERRIDEEEVEKIKNLRLFVRIRCLSSWKACSVFACQRSPRSDPACCITWLPVPLEKVKVRGLVFILFAASPPGGSTSQGCSPLSLTLLPFFPSILDRGGMTASRPFSSRSS